MVVAAVLASGVYVFAARDTESASTLVQGLAAVLVPGSTLAAWLWTKRLVPSDDPEPGASLDKAADVLAEQVRVQWTRAAGERRLTYPASIPVRWQWSNLPVAAPRSDAVGLGAGRRRFAPLPGLAEVTGETLAGGRLQDLLDIYGGLDSGRMVVLGHPGAGKTTAAIGLVLDALANRAGLDDLQRRDAPVPVMVTPHGWNPADQDLVGWLTRRISRDYPSLQSRAFGPDATGRLVRSGRLAVILDGLDDIPKDLRPVALRALGEQATFRLVVLTRTRELAAAAVEGPLPGAAALELQPVDAEDAARYLERCRIHPAPRSWQALIDHLRQDPEGVIARALDTPLMLSLVRDTYRGDDAVDELLDTRRFPDSQAIEDELLDQVLPAAYTPRPGHATPRYSLDQARCWLGSIAQSMNDTDTRDLAWWRIPSWMPAKPRKIITGSLLGLVFGIGFGSAFGLAAALTGGVAAGLATGLMGSKGRFLPTGLAGAIVLGTVVGERGPVLGPEFGFALTDRGLRLERVVGEAGAVLTCWLVMMFAMKFTNPAAEADRPIDPVVSWRRDRNRGLVVGLNAGFTAGFACGVAGWLGTGLAVGLMSALVAAPAAAVVVGVTYSRTWRTSLAFVQIRRANLGPIRMLRFLEDARDRGVLRTAGPVYQFRHARLQDRLGSTPELSHKTTGALPGPLRYSLTKRRSEVRDSA